MFNPDSSYGWRENGEHVKTALVMNSVIENRN